MDVLKKNKRKKFKRSEKQLNFQSLGCLLYALCFFSSPFDEVHERGDSIALAVQSEKLNFPKDKQ